MTIDPTKCPPKTVLQGPQANIPRSPASNPPAPSHAKRPHHNDLFIPEYKNDDLKKFFALDPFLANIPAAELLLHHSIQICALVQFSIPYHLKNHASPYPLLSLHIQPEQPLPKLHILARYTNSPRCTHTVDFPFQPLNALKAFVDIIQKHCTSPESADLKYVKTIIRALIDFKWHPAYDKTELHKYIKLLKINPDELRSLSSELFKSPSPEVCILGYNLFCIAVHYGPPEAALSAKELRNICDSLPKVIQLFDTAESRKQFLNDLHADLQNHLGEPFLVADVFRKMIGPSADLSTDDKSLQWSLIGILSESENMEVTALCKQIIEEELLQKKDVDAVKLYHCLKTLINLNNPDNLYQVLRFLSFVNSRTLFPHGQQLQLLNDLCEKYKKVPRKIDQIVDQLRIFKLYTNLLGTPNASDVMPNLTENILWNLTRINADWDPVTALQCLDLINLALNNAYIEANNSHTSALALYICRRVIDTSPESSVACAKVWVKCDAGQYATAKDMRLSREEFLMELIDSLYKNGSIEAVELADTYLNEIDKLGVEKPYESRITGLRRKQLRTLVGNAREVFLMQELAARMDPSSEVPDFFPVEPDDFAKRSCRMDAYSIIRLSQGAQSDLEGEVCQRLCTDYIERVLKEGKPESLHKELVGATTLLQNPSIRALFKENMARKIDLWLMCSAAGLRLPIEKHHDIISSCLQSSLVQVFNRPVPSIQKRHLCIVAQQLSALQSAHHQPGGKLKPSKSFKAELKNILPKFVAALRTFDLIEEAAIVFKSLTTYSIHVETCEGFQENILWFCEQILANSECLLMQVLAIEELLGYFTANDLLPATFETNKQLCIYRSLIEKLFKHESFEKAAALLRTLQQFPDSGHHRELAKSLVSGYTEPFDDLKVERALQILQHPYINQWADAKDLAPLCWLLSQYFMQHSHYEKYTQLLISHKNYFLASPHREKYEGDAARLCINLVADMKNAKERIQNLQSTMKLLIAYSIPDGGLWIPTLLAVAHTKDANFKSSICETFLQAMTPPNKIPLIPESLAQCWEHVVHMICSSGHDNLEKILRDECPLHAALADPSMNEYKLRILTKIIQASIEMLGKDRKGVSRPATLFNVSRLRQQLLNAIPLLKRREHLALHVSLLDCMEKEKSPDLIMERCQIVMDILAYIETPKCVFPYIESILKDTSKLAKPPGECLNKAIALAAAGRGVAMRDTGIDLIPCTESLIIFNIPEAFQEAARMVGVISQRLKEVQNRVEHGELCRRRKKMQVILENLPIMHNAKIAVIIEECLPDLLGSGLIDAAFADEIHAKIVLQKLWNANAGRNDPDFLLKLIEALNYFKGHFPDTFPYNTLYSSCLHEVFGAASTLIAHKEHRTNCCGYDEKLYLILRRLVAEKQKLAEKSHLMVSYLEYVKELVKNQQQVADCTDSLYTHTVNHILNITSYANLNPADVRKLVEDFIFCIPPGESDIPDKHLEETRLILDKIQITKFFALNYKEYALLEFYLLWSFNRSPLLSLDEKAKILLKNVEILCSSNNIHCRRYALLLIKKLEMKLVETHSGVLINCYQLVLKACRDQMPDIRLYRLVMLDFLRNLPELQKLNERYALNVCISILISLENSCKPTLQIELLRNYTSFLYNVAKKGLFTSCDDTYIVFVEHLFKTMIGSENAARSQIHSGCISHLLLENVPQLISTDSPRMRLLRLWIEHTRQFNHTISILATIANPEEIGQAMARVGKHFMVPEFFLTSIQSQNDDLLPIHLTTDQLTISNLILPPQTDPNYEDDELEEEEYDEEEDEEIAFNVPNAK